MGVEQQMETGEEKQPILLHRVPPFIWSEEIGLSVKSLVVKILIIALLIALLYALQVSFRRSGHG